MVEPRRVKTHSSSPHSGWDRFYRLVRAIPAGRVATYGGIAALAGEPRSARQVGFALAALVGPRSKLPWQRVLGAKGRGFAAVTIRDPAAGARQRALLEAEGVVFDRRGRVDLVAFGWKRAFNQSTPQRSRRSRRASLPEKPRRRAIS